MWPKGKMMLKQFKPILMDADRELAQVLTGVLQKVWMHRKIQNPDGSLNWKGVEDAIVYTFKNVRR
jgi:sulfur transfer protein SufE